MRKVYHLDSRCEVCERPIVPGQTWKFTPGGGKVHYYCAQQNPEPLGDIRTLEQGIFEHAGGRPHRAYSVAKAKVRNEHGVLETYTVYANRTNNRWWLEKLVGEEPDLSEGWMSPRAQRSHQTLFYEFATSSPKKSQEWIDAVNRLAGGVENPAGHEPETLEGLIKQEGRRIAHRFHPEEWGAPVSREYFDFHLYKHPEDVIPGWHGMLPQERHRAESQLFNAYLREAQKILAGTAREGNPAGPTYLQAISQARSAGARIGDTDGFEGWLRKAKLEGRSPLVRSKLKAAFWEGVDKGEVKATSTSRQDYHGAQVWRAAEGWKTSVDPDSDFDSLSDAKRFVDAQRNPNKSRTYKGYRFVVGSTRPQRMGEYLLDSPRPEVWFYSFWELNKPGDYSDGYQTEKDAVNAAKAFVDAQSNPSRVPRSSWIKKFNDVFKNQQLIYYSRYADQWMLQDWGGPGGHVRPIRLFGGFGEVASRKVAEEWAREQLQGHQNPAENPFDFEASAREFGMNVATGKGLRIQVLRHRVKKAQKELDDHRAWLRSKDYEDDGVAKRLAEKLRWLEIALDEYERIKKGRSA